MKILIAPDSFKACLTAKQICDIFEKNLDNHKLVLVPMADGGEGTTIALCREIVNMKTCGPNYNIVDSYYGIMDDYAIIEMATTSGFGLATKKNPYYTTTYGVGQLIIDALDKNIRKFIIGLGGSATNDGGLGMLRALGIKFTDKFNKEVKDAVNIDKIIDIDLSNFDKRLNKCSFELACDVENPFIGPNGASYIFGPQKGATIEMVKKLDSNLTHFAKIILDKFNIDINVKGAGAAGGLGGAFIAFLNGKIKKGIDLVIEKTNLEEKIKDVDLVITGEGKSDYQTKFGKTPYGVLKLAKKYSKPVYLFSGRIEDKNELLNIGFDKLIEISPRDIPIKIAVKNANHYLKLAIDKEFKK